MWKWSAPDTFLPPHLAPTLYDVKVGRDKGCHGPDDKIYNNNPDIRDKVARGNTVLEIKNTDTGELVEHDMVVHALKKFSGAKKNTTLRPPLLKLKNF